MKKRLSAGILLLALCGAAAFAQDDDEANEPQVKIGSGTLTIGAKIMTGIEATWDDHGNEDGKVRMFNEKEGTQLRAEFSPKYENNNVGFMMRFRADDAEVGKAAAGIRYAFGWIDLFDAHFRATGGYLDINSNIWGTIGDLDVDVAGAGLRLEARPIDGISVGAFFRVPDQEVDAVRTGGFHTTGQTPDFEQFFKSTAIGLAYKHDAFYLRLQYLIDANVFDTGDDGSKSNDQKNGQLDFGVGVTALPALEFHVEGRVQNIEDDDAAPRTTDLRQTLYYTISEDLPLTVGLKAKEVLWGYDNTDTYMIFKPYVAYKVLDNTTVSVEGGYGFGTYTYATNTPFTVDSQIFVRPKVECNFGYGFAGKLWYKFEKIAPKGGDDQTNHTIQLEFTWQL